jgi:hypothetical protein
MSFSDMMTSARGPGVIGMLMALVVLVGFGLLFMFAFDEGMQGGAVTIESEIASQAKELDSLRAAVVVKEEVLKQAPSRSEDADKLRLMKVASTTLEEKSGRLRSDIEEETATIKELEETWAAYKDEYREFVRGKATGEKLELLEVRDGTVYKEVNIREVTAIGMQIRHASGFKRLPFEELSDEMQDYYQYDPLQKDEALAAERTARKQHEAAAGVAMDRQAEELARQKAQEDAEAKEGIRRDISRKQAQIKDAEDDIRQLEAERARADSAAAAARAAGRMHLSKANNINGKIRAKKNLITELKSDIRRLQSQL